jgi:hypothetical protein
LYYGKSDHEFQCSPQHFHAELLQKIVNRNDVTSFSIVRHPILRTISEFQYRNELRIKKGLKPLSFEKAVNDFFFNYEFNPYIYDNHIRPQIEFIFPKTKLFKIENGMSAACKFSREHLIHSSVEDLFSEQVVNKSPQSDFVIKGHTLRKIYNFYQLDFKMLNYDMPFFKTDSIKCSELKDELLQSNHNANISYSDEIMLEYQKQKFSHSHRNMVTFLNSCSLALIKAFYRLKFS